MLNLFMLLLIIFFGILLFILIWNAPVGYEDETGFHYGEKNMTYAEKGDAEAYTQIEKQLGKSRDLYEQREFNKRVLNLCGLWLSGFMGGFSLMFILWLWFGQL